MLDGASRLRVPMPALGFGAAQLGNLFRETSDEEAAEAVERRVGRPVSATTTPPRTTGSDCPSGASARRWPDGRGTRLLVSTKVGRLLVPSPDDGGPAATTRASPCPASARRVWDFSADGVRRSLDAQPRAARAGPGRHRLPARPGRPLARGVRAPASPRSSTLREQGVIDAIGVGMNQSAMPAEFVRRHDIDLVMLAGRYTLLDQSALDDLLPLAVERGVRHRRRRGLQLRSAQRAPAGRRAPRTTTSRRRRTWSTGPGASPRSARRTASTCRPPRSSSRCATRPSPRWSSAPGPPIRSASTSRGWRRPYPMTCGPSSSPPDWSVRWTERAHDDDHRGPGARRPVPHVAAVATAPTR